MKKALALVLSLVMLLGICGTAFADSLTPDPTEREIRNSEFVKNMAGQGYVLLKNNGILPLDKEADNTIALYGSAIRYTVPGGTGSGAVNTRPGAVDNIPDAFANAGWEIADADYVASIKTTRVTMDSAIPADALEAGQAADTAIYAIARNAGEGSDRQPDSGNGAYNLTNAEKANLTAIADAFENVIVVLNTCVVDTTFINSIENVDAIVFMANGGVRSGEALEEVITGVVNPSGKLTDTWAASIYDYPSTEAFGNRDGNQNTEWYTDGIYVGYRYFDTFGVEVNYPFGFGLSYTDFEIDVLGVDITAEKVTVEAAVTNVGKEYSGKEVVQVYFSAPDGELEKPYQELAAYGKTDELAPGKTQILTISYDTTDMSSYSEERAAYIMEPGEYIIRVGNCSRNTHVAAVGVVEELIITEQLSNQLALEEGAVLEEMSKAGATPITYEGEADEIAAAPRTVIEGIETVNNAAPNDEQTITTYLFAEDAENYIARDSITLKTKEVAGIIRNRPQASGEGELDMLPIGGNARYVRLNFSNPATNYGFSFYELMVYSGGQNVARGKTATAKTIQTNSGTLLEPAFGIDGNNNTRWGSDWNGGDTVTSWYEVDLGAEYPLDGIAMLWEAAYARNVQVQISVDGVNYTTGATGSVPGSGMTVSGGTTTIRGYSTTTYSEVVEIVPDLPEDIARGTAKLTDVLSGKITLKQLVADMTVVELSSLCVGINRNSALHGVTGYTGITTNAYEDSRHIPGVSNTDGPAGVRVSVSYRNTLDNQTHYRYLTYFPAGMCVAQTWDRDLIYAEGIAVGEEMKDVGSSTWLAPGMNIHRNPLCGRNFEYYSEDPLVAGLTAAYITLGVQSHSGIGTMIKHFWGNSQETNRNSENNVIGERTAREIYLKGFEICVKLAQPQAIMNCYNENNGWPGSDDWDTNEDITRGEWGFKGIICTDWGGGQSTAYIAKHGGCDLVMPGGNANVVYNYVGVQQPTFNADGSIRSAGSFEPKTGGSVAIVVPSDVESEEFLPESVATAVANEEARYDKYGDDATITWYGEYSAINRICLGDVQKSAMRMLQYAMESDRMEALVADKLGEEYVAGSVSELHDAIAADEEYTPVIKSDILDFGIVADTITVDTVADKTAAVDVFYNGDTPISTARLTLVSDLPIADIESDYDFEYNEETNEIIVYDGAGEEISGVLFTLKYEFDAVVPDGEYPVDLGILEVTDMDTDVTFAVAIDGAIIVDNNYPIGDVTQDGEVDNRDLIMIARYLVHLVEFNEKQKIAADFNEDGIINNTDLVLIARAIVAEA